MEPVVAGEKEQEARIECTRCRGLPIGPYLILSSNSIDYIVYCVAASESCFRSDCQAKFAAAFSADCGGENRDPLYREDLVSMVDVYRRRPAAMVPHVVSGCPDRDARQI